MLVLATAMLNPASAMHAPLAGRARTVRSPLGSIKALADFELLSTFSVAAMPTVDFTEADVGVQAAWMYITYVVSGKITGNSNGVAADENDTASDDESNNHAVEYLPDGRSVSFESRFGWHNVDLRTPLPPLCELERLEHQIGVRDGKRVYLCTAKAAVKFGLVEKSRDFSEYYGTKLYVCAHA